MAAHLYAPQMHIECSRTHVAYRECRSLRRGNGLLLTRTIRARSQRLQKMMDVPVHNLMWILQKQSTEVDAKEDA